MIQNISNGFNTYMIRARKAFIRNWDLYLIMVPIVIYFVIFYYAPMYGIQIAFRDYRATRGITGSTWVGLEHFRRFFSSAFSQRIIVNTIQISVYSLIAGFPLPILLALMLNEVKNKTFKKSVQTITYAPYFLSTVVLVGIVVNFLNLRSGLVNQVIRAFGGRSINFMMEPSLFRRIYVISGVWQSTGFNSIVYIAALAGIDPTLYEAAIIDGASRLERIRYIALPGLLPTVVILLILNCGMIMNVSFERVFLMRNDLNLSTSDVISTYVYRSGLVNADFSFASAVGAFNSVVNFGMVIIVNFIARKIGDTSLF